ncbi:hypothetical protein LUZ63_009389 [Rhynchospora breviuscula]|uniref:UDP-glycosyltransferases domain-containing protein n=1 Tax=Rhynchospora breviuscula TaxID=2022672 RepID=A0A9Q0CF01_9POAL|nr:hypothetical protein LUZ63_009389 [Rhynchospora breviuscula]
MPEGFLDRTKGKGMVIHSWVPQLQVMQHEAVGGFVTHCGWNSILEAVTAGVPMICWPLYAEQRLNKLVVVEEIKIGAVMEGYDEDIVNADQVEAKVRWLMESEGGRIIKERVAMLKDKVAEALREDGSSSKALMQFVTDLRGTNTEEKCKSKRVYLSRRK